MINIFLINIIEGEIIMKENEKIIEVKETSEKKGKEVITKVKNWFSNNGEKIAACAGVIVAGVAGFVLGKASTYDYEDLEEIPNDEIEVVDNDSITDENNEE